MKLVTYKRGKTMRSGLAIEGMIVDLEKGAKALIGRELPGTVRGLLEGGPAAMRAAGRVEKKAAALIRKIDSGKLDRPAWMLTQKRARLCAPVPDPEKVVCLGLNYRDHCAEQSGRLGRSIEPPKTPVIFAKFPSSLTGPFDPIVLPPSRVTKQVDYEAELALVFGRTTRGVTQKEAMDCVAGFMVMNDVSARDCQFADRQWVRGKSFDGFAPCGPWLVTPEEIGDPHKLKIWAKVNGQLMQDGTTSDMIFKLSRVIAYLSAAMTFKPGDILTTGTPAGVGVFRDPPVLLKAGDTVECGIEKIGSIINVCEKG